MTEEDLDITVALARFMEWPEAKTYNDFEDTTVWPGRGLHWCLAVVAGEVITSGGRQKPEEWHPLTRPDHAAMVMEQAALKGWEARTRMTRHLSFASVWEVDLDHLVDRIGFHQEVGGSAASMCRAVCLAVIEAIKKAGVE